MICRLPEAVIRTSLAMAHLSMRSAVQWIPRLSLQRSLGAPRETMANSKIMTLPSSFPTCRSHRNSLLSIKTTILNRILMTPGILCKIRMSLVTSKVQSVERRLWVNRMRLSAPDPRSRLLPRRPKLELYLRSESVPASPNSPEPSLPVPGTITGSQSSLVSQNVFKLEPSPDADELSDVPELEAGSEQSMANLQLAIGPRTVLEPDEPRENVHQTTGPSRYTADRGTVACPASGQTASPSVPAESHMALADIRLNLYIDGDDDLAGYLELSEVTTREQLFALIQEDLEDALDGRRFDVIKFRRADGEVFPRCANERMIPIKRAGRLDMWKPLLKTMREHDVGDLKGYVVVKKGTSGTPGL